MAKWKLNEKAISEQLAKAKERTSRQDEIEPRATAVHYDQGSHRIIVELNNGADFRFSPASVQELAGASPDEITQVEVSPSGRTLRWKKLDADLSLPGLMAGIFGTKTWMAHLGRLGGQATSEAKAAAARLNGMKGGRPKKVAEIVHVPGRKTSHAGEWKTKTVTTSPSRKDTKSHRSVSGSALTQKGKAHSTHRTVLRDVKTHSKASRTLEDRGHSVGTYTDKKKKK